MDSHEEAFVQSFIAPARKERFSDFVRDKRKREKFIRELAHPIPDYLDPRYVERVPKNQDSPSQLHQTLTAIGAPATCYVISEGSLDGCSIDLLQALQQTVGYGMGTIISCIPGQLVYIETEDVRLIARR